jgi:hypothetical protein
MREGEAAHFRVYPLSTSGQAMPHNLGNRPLTAEEAGVRLTPLSVGAAKRWIASLLVSEHIRNGVGFLGQVNSRGEFIPHGTVFFVMRSAGGYNFPYLVAAKHVIDDIPGNSVMLRVNTQAGIARYVPILKQQWVTHPDHNEERGRHYRYIDVVAYKLSFDYRELDMTFFWEKEFLTEEILSEYNVGVGDEVIIMGLFFSHYGEVKNVPIVRVGNIAAMPDEPLPTDRGPMDGYLIEVRSIGGISGSPVFTHLAVRPENTILPATPYPQLEHKQLPKSEKYHFLIGLVHGYYTINTQEDWVSRTDQQVGDLNTGITIVVPASKISETLNGPELLGADTQMAEETIENRRRQSGAKSAAIPAPKTETSERDADENPLHREDFNRLVSAAAKRRPPSDQT